MNDLIRRQEILTFIEKSVSEYGNRYSVDMLNMWGLFAQVVKDMPSAQQWIPCSERMPEEYVSVLCYQPIYEGNNIWIGYLNADGFWVDSDGWEKLTNPATAWMPLPEPFKDKHED